MGTDQEERDVKEYIVEKHHTSGGWTWAEPKGELIRCRDCRFYSKDTLHCDTNAGKWFVSDYCSYAEGKEHETD